MATETETVRSTSELAALVDHERLVPIMPMVYVAWSDGDLTPDEIRNIRRAASESDWLDEEAKEKLADWLDPEHPPDAKRLNRLLRAIQSAAGEMEPGERIGLADLGVRIAELDQQREEGLEEGEVRDETLEALEDIEDALGMASEDACRGLLSSRLERPKAPVDEPDPAFEKAAMRQVLDGPWCDTWNRMRELLQGDEFEYVRDVSKEEYREKVYEWLQILADEGLGALAYSEAGSQEGGMGEFITSFEALAMFDQSLVVKYGVQFGLFGGSINFLGGDRHRQEYLPRVADLELPGGFAMTELGHGSNVRDIETVARYDPETDEFVVDTPCETARKEWIGNAAAHGEMVTVFAQLEVGEERHGVHAFLVPIRDDDGEALPGVRIEDCGHKMGLNGVDNGRLWFDEVRIPRDNLLDRYGSVDEEGEYSSPIPSEGKRFFTMLGTLVGGRVSVAGASLTAMKSALAIATRYGAMRRQFGSPGEPERAILDYRTHKRRLMPQIAAAYGLSFSMHYLKQRYLDKTDEDSREVEALAAGLKAYATWTARDAIQTARECCGGMGYLTENRIAQLRRDIDIYTTFEGDNTVLMLLVARGLLGEFKSQFEDERFFSMVRYVASQAATAVQDLNPVVTRITDRGHLRGAEFQRDALSYRENDLVRSAAQRLQARLQDGMPAFEAAVDIQDHLVALAHAHVERVVLDQFQAGIEGCDSPELTDQLELLRSVWAMDRIYEDIGWYLEAGFVEPVKSRAIRTELNEVCEEAREQAVHYVDSFGLPNSCLSAPIAFEEQSL